MPTFLIGHVATQQQSEKTADELGQSKPGLVIGEILPSQRMHQDPFRLSRKQWISVMRAQGMICEHTFMQTTFSHTQWGEQKLFPIFSQILRY